MLPTGLSDKKPALFLVLEEAVRLRVTNPAWGSRPSPQKRFLRRLGATQTAKRGQRVPKAGRLALKYNPADATAKGLCSVS